MWVCADLAQQAGESGLPRPSDGGAGMAAEEEHAGAFILEAARARRRSLGAF